MSAIGPGDFVECIEAVRHPGLVGRLFIVSDVFDSYGRCECRRRACTTGLSLANGPAGRWCGLCFRPIYRPDETLTKRLMEPLPDALAPEQPERISEPETA